MPILPFPLEDRYYRFSYYLRKKFGEKVHRISLDAGFTCPTRDGKLGRGGCLYCDNASFSRIGSEKLIPVRDQLITGIERIKQHRKARKYLAYFQSYTNTYAPVYDLEKLYQSVLDIPDVVGILIGTRPDCVNDNILQLLKDLNRDIYVSIEFGIESVYNKTLKWARRMHDFAATERAIEQSKNLGLHVAGHIIFGFPTESREEILASAGTLNRLKLDALKIHHLHIVKNSALADLYQKSPFPLFMENEWIKLVSDFLERLSSEIVIQRLVSDAMPGTLIAPRWTLSKMEILSRIEKILRQRDSYQGKLIQV